MTTPFLNADQTEFVKTALLRTASAIMSRHFMYEVGEDLFEQTFIRPQDREILRSARVLTGGPKDSSGRFYFKFRDGARPGGFDFAPGAPVSFYMQNSPFLLPTYMVNSEYQSAFPLETSPPEVVDALHEWAADAMRVNMFFSDMVYFLEMVRDACWPPAWVKAFFPAIGVLIGTADLPKADVKQNQLDRASKAPRLPRLDRKLKARLLEVSDFVSALEMLRGQPGSPFPSRTVRLYLRARALEYPTVLGPAGKGYIQT